MKPIDFLSTVVFVPFVVVCAMEKSIVSRGIVENQTNSVTDGDLHSVIMMETTTTEPKTKVLQVTKAPKSKTIEPKRTKIPKFTKSPTPDAIKTKSPKGSFTKSPTSTKSPKAGNKPSVSGEVLSSSWSPTLPLVTVALFPLLL